MVWTLFEVSKDKIIKMDISKAGPTINQLLYLSEKEAKAIYVFATRKRRF